MYISPAVQPAVIGLQELLYEHLGISWPTWGCSLLSLVSPAVGIRVLVAAGGVIEYTVAVAAPVVGGLQ